MKQICDDLAKEHEELDAVVADLDDETWKKKTPLFKYWSIQDEITHLAFFDGAARLSAIDPEGFEKQKNELVEGIESPTDMHLKVLEIGRKMTPAKLLEWWREERTALLEALRSLEPKTRVPWYGPSMSVRSSATARLMETWGHGQDVMDTLGIERPSSARLKNVAHLGVVTLGWSYTTNNIPLPDKPVRVELTNPTGELWTWGPEDAENIVRGEALDFCLVAIRRRHYKDTNLEIVGPVAEEWISIAQAFAGPPEPCPEPGTYPKPSRQV